MRIVISLLLVFFTAFSQPYSDVRLEIISKIKKLQEEKEKVKSKSERKKIENKIKKLKELLKKYEESNITAG
ncbi:hypothetical protein [Hydrogenivirga sp. 128-5-R1-1]|uniref:hypothetical protein n=1 Tax=Hydrogenivirga sp. 128-5-R1-1 TaxID=392423 RepID=UPI00015F074C|nr:hypothetical protein [Hydrogenivirga sp. 128-5-R1-1]EDP74156.1 hypothetical protein HG1285_10827 [Hydrogenivirga sp. 128-5-R1-1]